MSKQKPSKRVSFDESRNRTYQTFSSDSYNRKPIDSILYRKCCNKVSAEEWLAMQQELHQYILTEMTVHISSLTFIKGFNSYN